MNDEKLTLENIFDADENNDVKRTRIEWEEIIDKENEIGSGDGSGDVHGDGSGDVHGDGSVVLVIRTKIFKSEDSEYKVFEIDGDFFIKSASGYPIKIIDLERVTGLSVELSTLFKPIYWFKDSLTREKFSYDLINEIVEFYDIDFSEENEAENEAENEEKNSNKRKCVFPWEWFQKKY